MASESPLRRVTTGERRVHALVAAACFLVVVAVTGGVRTVTRLLAGWDTATLIWLALSWRFAWRSSASGTREWARGRTYGESQFDRTVAVLFSLFGLGSALGLVTLAEPPTAPVDHVQIWLSAVAVVLAWLALNTEYAAHYATLYYGDRPPERGLAFPGDPDPEADVDADPDHRDFAYFAFTLGTAISTSDVAITSSAIRTTALGHVLLAFAYNTGVLGLVVNLANLYA
ncbi:MULTISPECIES: DUF1345 domain-containing protein [Halorussus]|uniref:DUF1345 domain-containing protein n=1 Tax=Halorussus TaxID=1070314 RepID=UPI00209D11E4|nr:DUF1345 domain-containing protein [Halorussus vallis]USZ77184.1 DUF1345 domain-containing protein [Halorussus vallis]